MLPAGAFKTGDTVFPPTYIHTPGRFDMNLPETAGYTLVGTQDLDGMKVYVMRMNENDVVMRNRDTGRKHTATLQAVRYFDAATMLPVYFDGYVFFHEKDGTSISHMTMSRLSQ